MTFHHLTRDKAHRQFAKRSRITCSYEVRRGSSDMTI
jgi:hypothetical protein